LLLYFEVERQIDVLKPCKKVFIPVYKRPTSLHESQIRIVL
jgi:hypothetical protein